MLTAEQAIAVLDLDALRALLDAGESPNRIIYRAYSFSLLGWAIWKEFSKGIDLLLDYGANVNVDENIRTEDDHMTVQDSLFRSTSYMNRDFRQVTAKKLFDRGLSPLYTRTRNDGSRELTSVLHAVLQVPSAEINPLAIQVLSQAKQLIGRRDLTFDGFLLWQVLAKHVFYSRHLMQSYEVAEAFIESGLRAAPEGELESEYLIEIQTNGRLLAMTMLNLLNSYRYRGKLPIANGWTLVSGDPVWRE